MAFHHDPVTKTNCRNGGRQSKRTRTVAQVHERDDEPSAVERPRKLRVSEQAVRVLRRLWPDPIELQLNRKR